MRKRDILFIGWGVLLWLAATMVFHFFGDRLLPPASLVPIILSFLLIVPIIYGAMSLIYAGCRVPAGDRARSAICTAVPGMLLDMAGMHWSGFFFPVMSAKGLSLLSIWLLWAYSLILLMGLRAPAVSPPFQGSVKE
ncbi:DUF5367 family protein [Paenibacillus silviterrae]|uniref:DUF5367 family protein n=1 Tax=Paenibacillus silviterrae TaxID=3242194 RepID=UPI0025439288|nr:DUF5367 family protein [Paenibacillus chinjuensis]